MKKLNLDGLKVESFATSALAQDIRGSVAAHQAARGTQAWCPVSYGGTCIISVCLCYSEEPC